MTPGALAIVGVLVAGHMFGGMRSAVSNVLAARRVLVGAVTGVTEQREGAFTVDVRVDSVPCGTPEPAGTLRLWQLAEHGARYAVGMRAVFPVLPAGDSPHRPSWVPAEAWMVDQSDQEMLTLEGPAEAERVTAQLRSLCAAPAAQRDDAIVDLLVDGAAGLSAAAARELAMSASPPRLSTTAQGKLLRVTADTTRPLAIRVTAISVAGRTGETGVHAALAELVDPRQAPEVVAAAVRAVSASPGVLTGRVVPVLMGPAGQGRVVMARVLAKAPDVEAGAALEVMAWGPEAEATTMSCRALAAAGAADRLARLAASLPPERRAQCAAAAR